MLNAAEEQALEQRLRAYRDSTSNEIVVVSFETIAGRNLESYSAEWANTWGIGQEGADNGLLFFIVKRDRLLRLEVGYGLEQQLPDLLCSQILDRTVTPAFRVGSFYKGIDSALTQIQMAIGGKFSVDDFPRPPNRTAQILFYIFSLLFSLAFLVVNFPSPQRRPFALGAVALSALIVAFLEQQGGWLTYNVLLSLFIFLAIALLYTLAFRLGLRAEQVHFFKELPQKVQDPDLQERLAYLFDPEEVQLFLKTLLETQQSYPKPPSNRDIQTLRIKYEALEKLDLLSVSSLLKKMQRHQFLVDKGEEVLNQLEEALFFGRPLNRFTFSLTPRIDYRLRRIGRELRNRTFDPSVYDEAAVRQIKENLENSLQDFAPHSLKPALPQDLRRAYFEDCSFFLGCCNNPREHIALNIPGLWEKIEQKFTPAYWKRLKKKYTKSSVEKQQAKVEHRMAQVRSLGLEHPQAKKIVEELYFDYYENLVKRPSSSGLLVAMSSGSSSFSSGGSSFSGGSFGGGSFGGGGASGSW